MQSGQRMTQSPSLEFPCQTPITGLHGLRVRCCSDKAKPTNLWLGFALVVHFFYVVLPTVYRDNATLDPPLLSVAVSLRRQQSPLGIVFRSVIDVFHTS